MSLKLVLNTLIITKLSWNSDNNIQYQSCAFPYKHDLLFQYFGVELLICTYRKREDAIA